MDVVNLVMERRDELLYRAVMRSLCSLSSALELFCCCLLFFPATPTRIQAESRASGTQVLSSFPLVDFLPGLSINYHC